VAHDRPFYSVGFLGGPQRAAAVRHLGGSLEAFSPGVQAVMPHHTLEAALRSAVDPSDWAAIIDY
jgi:hypothetical protein